MRKFLRSIAGLSGLYKIYAYFVSYKRFGIRNYFKLFTGQLIYRNKILKAKPVNVNSGSIEVHMLLSHKRIQMGLWSLYSFLYFFGKPVQIIIHDDGTFNKSDLSKIRRIFPCCRVIDRRFADSVVTKYLLSEGLKGCLRFREASNYSLKLFDVSFFQQSDYCLYLDSDILFFSTPKELLNDLESGHSNRYLCDNQDVYSLSPGEMKALAGKDCLRRVNSGLMLVKKGVYDFHRIDKYLQHPGFWQKDGTPDFFIEQTVAAMELTIAGAQALPATYNICGHPRNPNLICGHYCGNGYHHNFFYTDGIPRLAKVFLRGL